jgi:hypothetical protein
MAKIQIIDFNPSDFASMEELTDEELLEINGGGLWDTLIRKIKDSIVPPPTLPIPRILPGFLYNKLIS